MRAVQGLHLALLIAGQNNGVFRRVQIQTDHILQLLDKLFVVGKFEGACQMRLQAMSPPDSPYRGLADAGCPGHQGPAPVRGVRRLPFDRLLHDPGPLPAADRGNPSTAGSVLFDSPEAIFNETIAPTSGLLTSDVQLWQRSPDCPDPRRPARQFEIVPPTGPPHCGFGSVAPVPSAQECSI